MGGKKTNIYMYLISILTRSGGRACRRSPLAAYIPRRAYYINLRTMIYYTRLVRMHFNMHYYGIDRDGNELV